MIVQRKVCDLCYHRDGDEGVDAIVTRTVTVDKRTVELDLCGPDDAVLSQGVAMFFEAGRRARSKRPAQPKEPPTPLPVEEPTCSCGRTFGTQRGLNRHITACQDGDEIHRVAA